MSAASANATDAAESGVATAVAAVAVRVLLVEAPAAADRHDRSPLTAAWDWKHTRGRYASLNMKFARAPAQASRPNPTAAVAAAVAVALGAAAEVLLLFPLCFFLSVGL